MPDKRTHGQVDSNLQQFSGELRWLASPVRWRPAAEGMVFFTGLAGPAVDVVEGKPDSVDVDKRQQNDAKLNEDTEATEVAPSQSGDGGGQTIYRFWSD